MSDTTVLVVDDEQGIVDSLFRIFSREGYQVLTAPDGRQALDLLRSGRLATLAASANGLALSSVGRTV